MKKPISTIILILFACITYASNQVKDTLILNSDTLYLYESPLEQIKNIYEKIHQKKREKYIYLNSGCWRGFTATWTVKDSTLYLKDVTDFRTGKNINVIIEQILDKKFHNHLLKADWVNGHFWSGKDSAPTTQLYISVFCHELRIDLKNGHLTNIEEKNYIPCEYFDENKLKEFILSHIDWSKLPDLKNRIVKLSAYVETNEKGEISNVKIENSSDVLFNEEFLRVLRMLPCMPVYFNEGSFYDVGESIEIKIDENTKKQYTH